MSASATTSIPCRPRRQSALRLGTLLLFAALAAIPAARAGDPVETWLGFTAKTSLSPRVTALVLVESKFRDDLGFRYQDYADLGVSIALNEHWSVAPILRVARTRASRSAPWRDNICPLPTVQWHDTLGGWRLDWRTQLEIHCREAASDMTTLRTRIQAMPPVSAGSRWQPYLNTEFFFDDHTHRCSQNRSFAGVYFRINDAWKVETYLGYKSDWSAGHWTHTRLIGTRLGFAF